jgi:hypothetical protein
LENKGKVWQAQMGKISIIISYRYASGFWGCGKREI